MMMKSVFWWNLKENFRVPNKSLTKITTEPNFGISYSDQKIYIRPTFQVRVGGTWGGGGPDLLAHDVGL